MPLMEEGTAYLIPINVTNSLMGLGPPGIYFSHIGLKHTSWAKTRTILIRIIGHPFNNALVLKTNIRKLLLNHQSVFPCRFFVWTVLPLDKPLLNDFSIPNYGSSRTDRFWKAL